MKRIVNIGTRRSRLAQNQSQSVLDDLSEIYQQITFGLTTIVTIGDKKKSTPVESLPSYGAFVKELQDALLSHKIDIAVHSLKDLPVDEAPGLAIAAVTKRLDPRDVLISRRGKLDDLPSNSVIGTGSPRRTFQLLSYRSNLKVQPIRGNIDTRLAKLDRGEFDAIIIAAAGLLRLKWEDKITEYLSLDHFLPEAGQAAMAIEVRADDQEMIELVKPLHDEVTSRCVAAERFLLKAMGGGCASALGTLGTIDGNILLLKGMAQGPGGLLVAQECGAVSNPEKVAEQLSLKLFSLGARREERHQ
jgi:hydroxymethylbilane synthase